MFYAICESRDQDGNPTGRYYVSSHEHEETGATWQSEAHPTVEAAQAAAAAWCDHIAWRAPDPGGDPELVLVGEA